MKRYVSILLTLSILFVLSIPVTANVGSENSTRLYNVYGDNMLFQHRTDVILAGTSDVGKTIKAELFDSENSGVKQSTSVTGTDGTFSVKFTAPQGSYEKYKIVMSADGVVFQTLNNVVFGELWLTGGQSNMQLELSLTETGREMLSQNIRGSENVRIFYSAPNPEYNGKADNLPFEPQKEIPGCCWFDATSDKIFNITGVGYFFAEKLQQDIDMPVGILSGSLGGSCISSWLPRKYIEETKEIIKLLGNDYYTESKWSENGDLNFYVTASGMYNKKIAPLENFRPAGMIWYQGESDCGKAYGEYSEMFDLLQKSYSELFGFKDKLMPIVYTALCVNYFGDINAFQRISSEFAEMQADEPETRACIPVSDIPLTYVVDTSTIHPTDKKPVGCRMAYAAEGLVYKMNRCFAGAYIKKCEIIDNEVKVTFANVGDGLACSGDRLVGFTICGADGAYIPADAEIISKDTVSVKCKGVEKPVAVMYGNGLITERGNLYATVSGKLLWPALPMISNWSYVNRIWNDFGWTDCDSEKIWRNESLQNAGNFDIWESTNADISIVSESAYKGSNGLNIKGNGQFSVSPITEYKDVYDNDTIKDFVGFNRDWRSFDTLSVMLRNDGNSDVKLTEIKLYTGKDKYVTPILKDSKDLSYVLPHDGQWHCVTFNLDTLRFSGKNYLVCASRVYLNNVSDVEFCFEGSNSEISFDEIEFSTSNKNVPVLKSQSFDPISLLFNGICFLISIFIMMK